MVHSAADLSEFMGGSPIHSITHVGDKGCDSADFVDELRSMKVTRMWRRTLALGDRWRARRTAMMTLGEFVAAVRGSPGSAHPDHRHRCTAFAAWPVRGDGMPFFSAVCEDIV